MKSTVTPVLRAAREDASRHHAAIQAAKDVLASEARAIRSLPAGAEKDDRLAAHRAAEHFLSREESVLQRRMSYGN